MRVSNQSVLLLALAIVTAQAGHICVKEQVDKLERVNSGIDFLLGLVNGFAEGKALTQLDQCKQLSIDMTDDFVEFLSIIDKIRSGHNTFIEMAEDLDHLLRVGYKAP